MDRNETKVPAFYLAILAVLGWFALIAQLYLIIVNRIDSVGVTIIRYFSFFTILTNIIVAVCATVLLLKSVGKWDNFFSKPATLTAITVYIAIVGGVYNALLRYLWQPKGLQYVVDELLHTIIPLMFIFLWRIYVNVSSLKYKDVWPWLIYPLLYVIYIAIRGALTNEYPYPFIDVTKLGYSIVAINCVGLLLAFLGLSLLLVVVGKKGDKIKE